MPKATATNFTSFFLVISWLSTKIYNLSICASLDILALGKVFEIFRLITTFFLFVFVSVRDLRSPVRANAYTLTHSHEQQQQPKKKKKIPKTQNELL